jgi:hypothetical protein
MEEHPSININIVKAKKKKIANDIRLMEHWEVKGNWSVVMMTLFPPIRGSSSSSLFKGFATSYGLFPESSAVC